MTAAPVRRNSTLPARTRAGERLSRFCFTINNYTEALYTDLTVNFAPTTKWFVVGREVGAEGTPHLQGACVLGKQMAFNSIKRISSLATAHIEPMKGTPQDSLVYCSKEDAAPFTFGTLPAPGKRNDLHDAVERIQKGSTLKELAADEGGPAVVKFYKGLTVLRSLLALPRTEPPCVVWLCGPTGVHKTRCAMEFGAVLARGYGVNDGVWLSHGGLRWFDGYDGQPVAVLDDFRAKHVQQFSFFLRLLDRYPMSVEFKGGFVNWQPRVIFITAPHDPATVFAKRREHVPEDIAQLNRRIYKVYEFLEVPTDDDKRKILDDLTLCTGQCAPRSGASDEQVELPGSPPDGE